MKLHDFLPDKTLWREPFGMNSYTNICRTIKKSILNLVEVIVIIEMQQTSKIRETRVIPQRDNCERIV